MKVYVLCVKTPKGSWRVVGGSGHLRVFSSLKAAEYEATQYINGKVEVVPMELQLVKGDTQ
jgi:hypothetical protein